MGRGDSITRGSAKKLLFGSTAHARTNATEPDESEKWKNSLIQRALERGWTRTHPDEKEPQAMWTKDGHAITGPSGKVVLRRQHTLAEALGGQLQEDELQAAGWRLRNGEWSGPESNQSFPFTHLAHQTYRWHVTRTKATNR